MLIFKSLRPKIWGVDKTNIWSIYLDMFTNPSKKEMSLGLGAHKSIQNRYCNEFAIILNVYFKSPAPTALGPLGAPSCLVWKPVPVLREERLRPQFVSIVGKRQILNSFDQFSLKCWLAGEVDFEVFFYWQFISWTDNFGVGAQLI